MKIAASLVYKFMLANRNLSAFLDRYHWHQYRLLIMLAILPLVFSWNYVSQLPNGMIYLTAWLLIANLGLTLGYHRYFAHKQFIASSGFKVILAFIASMSWQGSLNSWALQHRIHHVLSDEKGDPHSPRELSCPQKRVSFKSFYHAHYGWMSQVGNQILDRKEKMILTGRSSAYANRLSRLLGAKNKFLDFDGEYKYSNPYIADLVQNPLERLMSDLYALLSVLSNAIVILFAITVSFFQNGSFDITLLSKEIVSALYWGIIVRVVLTQEMSNINNSLGHSFGYRNFETKDCSRNNIVLGFLTMGEGFQNNHHNNPMSTKFSCKWFEIDCASIFLNLLFLTPLARPISSSSREFN